MSKSFYMFLGIVNIIALIIFIIMFPFILKLDNSFIIYSSIYPLSFFLIAIYAFRKYSSYYNEQYLHSMTKRNYYKLLKALENQVFFSVGC